MTTYLVKYAVKLIQTLFIPNQFLRNIKKKKVILISRQSLDLKYKSILK